MRFQIRFPERPEGHILQGADGIRALFLIRKTHFYFARDNCQWFAASLVLLQTCAVKNQTCTTFSTHIFQMPLAICAGENFDFFLAYENV